MWNFSSPSSLVPTHIGSSGSSLELGVAVGLTVGYEMVVDVDVLGAGVVEGLEEVVLVGSELVRHVRTFIFSNSELALPGSRGCFFTVARLV